MNRITPRPFVATLSYFRIATSGFPTLSCRSCRSILDIHQPDPNQSEQFLGTCSKCGRWYRLASSTDEAMLTVLELPDLDQIAITPQSARNGTN